MIDVAGCSDDARESVARAEMIARELGLAAVGTEHLLLGILTGANDAARALVAAGATVAATRHKVVETAGSSGRAMTDTELGVTARADRAVRRAQRLSHGDRSETVTVIHLLLGVLDVEGTAGQVLRGIGVDVGSLREQLTGAPVISIPGVPTTAPTASCPHCRAAVDELTFAIVTATDDGGRSGDAVVFSCRTCGAVLGVSRARV